MRRKNTRISPKVLLNDLSPELLQLANTLREIIHDLVPEVEEAGYPGWKLIGYRNRRYFGFIAPMSDHIRLGFEHGATLPDPEGLLYGDGRQVRYIPLYSLNDLQVEPIKDLILTAALRAAHD
jgi:hypothetical protein